MYVKNEYIWSYALNSNTYRSVKGFNGCGVLIERVFVEGVSELVCFGERRV